MISLRGLAVSIGLIVFLTVPKQHALSQVSARVRVTPGSDVVIVDSKMPGMFELEVVSTHSSRYLAVENLSRFNVIVTVQCGMSRSVFPLPQNNTLFIRVPCGVQFCVVTVTANNGRMRR
jgi:hypothetical protein